jgi:hypothetical protein
MFRLLAFAVGVETAWRGLRFWLLDSLQDKEMEKLENTSYYSRQVHFQHLAAPPLQMPRLHAIGWKGRRIALICRKGVYLIPILNDLIR